MPEQLEKKPRKGLSPVLNTLIFIVFVAVVVGLLFSISGNRSPRIPDDQTHAVITDAKACLKCHGPGMPNARKPDHPPKDQCMLCHKVRRYRNIKPDKK
jgi:flagellin-like protein